LKLRLQSEASCSCTADSFREWKRISGAVEIYVCTWSRRAIIEL